MRQESHQTSQAWLRGVLFCLGGILFCACDKPPETPDWPTHPGSTDTHSPAKPYSKAKHAEGAKTVFMVYNLKNYLGMPRTVDGKESIRTKPEKEIHDLVENIAKVNPDILGVCEIGTHADLQDLQKRLKAKHIHYPFIHLVGGSDAYRRQALLSKIPLAPHEKAKIDFELDGKRHHLLRGLLDVTIQLPCGEVRFVGAHLKSKRKSDYFDQALIRRNEAQLVREHADKLLKSTPNLIVYGDFNDTKESPSVRAIAGDYGASNYLFPLGLADATGHKWTHYWNYKDVYSRFDYAFVSRSLKQHVDMDASYIPTITKGNSASDHRPLVITFY